ncbi:S41 family peptidase [Clostridium sp. SYSU_GA19001]|uniref:S41 family peptidase n=1 Tax=Clostridium caldaquaticum TaxID=2940653 RepID=UPI0020777B25|nr:S41 family peptidase [Clostridium caldaquaticum]MCM8710169.1 S41 family peptidase [Clostridium caldaquaticum]
MKSKKKWVAWTVALVIATNLLTYFGTKKLSIVLPNGKVIGAQQYGDVSNFQKLFEVRNLIYKLYDGTIDDNVLLEGAIKGMTGALNDPYTVFMNQKEFEAFSTQTEGSYSGIGLQIEVKDDDIVVLSTFEDSPARKVGILPGDIIKNVDGTDVTGKEYQKAISMIKGQEGTTVNVTISRNEKETHTYTVKRAKINLQTVSGEMLPGNMAYIKISMFDEHTADDFSKKLKELKGQGAKGILLDLRQNPGGLLSSSVDVVSNFVSKGKVIVSTVDKYKKEEKHVSKGGIAEGMPLVVLIDGLTASASEIVSGAVRDYKVGTLVGEKTFGKGVVQTLVDTGDGTALKVTVSKYYTPNGENIHKTGIAPDVQVTYPEELLKKAYNRNTDPQFIRAVEVLREKMK